MADEIVEESAVRSRMFAVLTGAGMSDEDAAETVLLAALQARERLAEMKAEGGGAAVEADEGAETA